MRCRHVRIKGRWNEVGLGLATAIIMMTDVSYISHYVCFFSLCKANREFYEPILAFFRPVFSAIMEQRCQSCINPLWCSFVEATIQGVEHGMQQFLLVHAVLEIGTPKILPDMVYLERCILGSQKLSHTQPESWHSRFQIPIKQFHVWICSLACFSKWRVDCRLRKVPVALRRIGHSRPREMLRWLMNNGI